MMANLLTRLGLALMWLLHFLPLPLLACIGRGMGALGYRLARSRRKVVLVNLKLCFPDWSEVQRTRAAQEHFKLVARAFLEHGILWWSSKARIQKLVRIEGLEHWQSVQDKPVIWLAPHFVGLDMGASRIITEWLATTIYSKQSNPVFDRALLRGRSRFVTPRLFSRQDGVRPVAKAVREGLPLYYLPDMDLGERDAVFVPFFGVQTATVTGLARMARLARAAVVPAVSRVLPGGEIGRAHV